jgi:hypothetical protein
VEKRRAGLEKKIGEPLKKYSKDNKCMRGV